MTIEEFEQCIRNVPERPASQRHAAIRCLCLEFARPLAKAVETLNEPLAGSSHVLCPACFAELPAHAEHCPVKPVVEQTREVLAALKEEKGDDDARRT